MVSTKHATGDQRKPAHLERVAGFAVGFEKIGLLAADQTRGVFGIQANLQIGKRIQYIFIVFVFRPQLFCQCQGFFFLANRILAVVAQSFSTV